LLARANRLRLPWPVQGETVKLLLATVSGRRGRDDSSMEDTVPGGMDAPEKLDYN